MSGFNSWICHFFLRFFIENNSSYLVGGNIISVAISTTTSGNITSVAHTDTYFSVSIFSAADYFKTYTLTNSLHVAL